MALFGKKEKPSTLEEIKRAYESLSEDDKKSFKESIKDHVDESVAAQKEDSGEKTEQSAEAEIHEAEGAEHAAGKGDVEELGEKDNTPEEQAEDKRDEKADKGEEISNLDPETEEERPEDKASEAANDTVSADNSAEMIKGLTDRVTALEESLKGINELKAKMDEFAAKQAAKFGYKSNPDGAEKDIHDMSTAELAERQKIKL